MFIKQFPMHPGDRLKELDKLRKADEIKFIKEVPVHPKDSLRRKADEEEVKVPVHPKDELKGRRKRKLVNYNELTKKSKNDDVVFIEQVLIHPRDR